MEAEGEEPAAAVAEPPGDGRDPVERSRDAFSVMPTLEPTLEQMVLQREAAEREIELLREAQALLETVPAAGVATMVVHPHRRQYLQSSNHLPRIHFHRKSLHRT